MKNQKEKNAARDLWRKRKRAEALAEKKITN